MQTSNLPDEVRLLGGTLLASFSECEGLARDSAKVEDQVRFLTWTLINNMACECDGFARRSSKPLDKVRFLGELLSVNGAVR